MQIITEHEFRDMKTDVLKEVYFHWRREFLFQHGMGVGEMLLVDWSGQHTVGLLRIEG